MKILALDIETSPNLVYVWGLWDQNVGLNQIVEQTRMLCWAAKWVGKKRVHFGSVHHDGRRQMVERIHALLDEADAVLHYNGTRFDIPHLNREFLQEGLEPPSPYEQIDLLTTVRRFKFPSAKLQNITTQLDLEGKVAHEGFDLWRGCMAGEDKAWRTMRRYNKRDVTLLEDLYEILLPWIRRHPNVRLYDDGAGCPRCGAPEDELVSRGYRRTAVSKVRRLQCKACGGFSTRTARESGTKVRPV